MSKDNESIAADYGYARPPRMATIKESAEILGLSENCVRQMVKGKKVQALRTGNKILVNIDKFIEFLNENTLSETDFTDDDED